MNKTGAERARICTMRKIPSKREMAACSGFVESSPQCGSSLEEGGQFQEEIASDGCEQSLPHAGSRACRTSARRYDHHVRRLWALRHSLGVDRGHPRFRGEESYRNL